MKESKSTSRISTKNGLLILLAFGVLWFGVRSHYIQLDYRFKSKTVNGIKGLVLYEIGDYQRAARFLRADLQDAYQKWVPEEETPRFWFMRGFPDKARKMTENNLQTGNDIVQSLLIKGEMLMEEGAYEKAVRNFDHLFEIENNYYDALLLSSAAHARLGLFDESLELITRALRQNRLEDYRSSFLRMLETTGYLSDLPEEEKPFSLLAVFHRYLRIYDHSHGSKARRYAKEAIKNGDHPEAAYLTMGILLEKEGKREKALEMFKMAAPTGVPYSEAYRWAANLHGRMGDIPNEFRMRKAAVETSPEDFYYLNSFLHLLVEKMGDYPKALSITEKHLELYPRDVEVLEKAGRYQFEMGNMEPALRYFERALSINPERSSVYMRIGRIYKRSNQLDEAMEAFQKAIELDPWEMGARVGLGGIYWDQQKMDLALIEYEKAYRSGYWDEGYADTLCTLYRDVGQHQKAIKCLRWVLSKDPENAYAKQLLNYSLKGMDEEDAD
ncbi:MAG TPA: tetratricopeptide repeat protein [Nitrospiria bacterium]